MDEIAKMAIDTTSLLTILGLVAAVWAVIPQKSHLNFRLRVTPVDWVVIFGIALLIHYLVFENVFRALGLYYSFGPWQWGLDKNSVVYLLLLGLVGYIFFRSKTTKLSRQNISVFERLFTTLLMTKQYGELAPLLEQHIKTVLAIADQRTIRDRLSKKIRPMPRWAFYIQAQPGTKGDRKDRWFKRTFRKPLTVIADKLEVNGKPEKAAKEIVRKLLASQSLTAYLAVSYPYLCLEILDELSAYEDEFVDNFMQALIEDDTSIFYSELKNNHNLNGHHRLKLPEENKLINFFFKDVEVAAKHGVYRSVGEVVCRRIEFDQKLTAAYNGPLGYYDEVGKYKCPIFCGIHFFQIMIHEGLHQGIQDHLWLYYFTHFTDKILEQLRPFKKEDAGHEFPSPYHYLLYKIVSITMEWVDEAQYVTDKSALMLEGESLRDNNGYIPFNAVLALGQIITDIISSKKLGDGFKTYMLEVVLRRLQKIQNVAELKPLSRVLVKAVIYRNDIWATDMEYRQELSRLYQKVDHCIRYDMDFFNEELARAIA